jgi:hypothetical protein
MQGSGLFVNIRRVPFVADKSRAFLFTRQDSAIDSAFVDAKTLRAYIRAEEGLPWLPERIAYPNAASLRMNRHVHAIPTNWLNVHDATNAP